MTGRQIFTLNSFISVPFAVVLLLSLVTAPAWAPLAVDGAGSWYDTFNPVASGKALAVKRGPDGVVILTAKITKLRGCDRIEVFAYAVDKSGDVRRVIMDRPGIASVGHLEAGETIVGDWYLHDMRDAKGILVKATYDCAGRTVVARLIEANI